MTHSGIESETLGKVVINVNHCVMGPPISLIKSQLPSIPYALELRSFQLVVQHDRL